MAYHEKNGKNGYKLVVDIGSGSKRVRKTKTIHAEQDLTPKKLKKFLDEELIKFTIKIERGEYIKPNKMSFDEFLNEWRNNYAANKYGAYTRFNYDGVLKRYISPEFGNIEIGKIHTLHIVNFITSLRSPEGRKKPRATNTILMVYKVLKSVFSAARTWDTITKSPMDGVIRPTPDKTEKREMKQKKKAYTRIESIRLIESLNQEPEHWRLYYMAAMLGGFRRGELLAVEWTKIDFIKGGIEIEKQITLDEEGNTTEDEVKTEDSIGFVLMPEWYLEELLQYKIQWDENKRRLGTKWRGGEKQYVFHSGSGVHFHPNSASVYWRKFLIRKELPLIPLHGLRHTAGGLLREKGAQLKDIQERLRHGQMSTTADIYTHESEQINRETVELLDDLNPKQVSPVSAPSLPLSYDIILQ